MFTTNKRQAGNVCTAEKSFGMLVKRQAKISKSMSQMCSREGYHMLDTRIAVLNTFFIAI